MRPLNFTELRRQVSIAQVLGHWGWQPQSIRGAQQRGACPLHEEAGTMSRSFAVHTDKNVYCCHRCGSEGNVLDLWVALGDKPILAAGWDMVQTFDLQPPLLKAGPPGTN